MLPPYFTNTSSGLNVRTVRKDPGEIFSLEELENAVITHRPALFFLAHGDSSTEAVQKLEGIGAMCHKHNSLFAVDAVASFCIHPIFIDRWEIDAISAASQKVVGATPGISMLSFSPKAQYC
jgi:alanine-glyoxylate transaminase/serine-glyoxylate transaminase/serine-pyruvate transaminase